MIIDLERAVQALRRAAYYVHADYDANLGEVCEGHYVIDLERAIVVLGTCTGEARKKDTRTAAERCLDAGFEDVMLLDAYSYDDALVGVTECGRAVYDFDAMAEWLKTKEGMTLDEAIEWIEYNTIRALPYAGEDAPLVMYRV